MLSYLFITLRYMCSLSYTSRERGSKATAQVSCYRRNITHSADRSSFINESIKSFVSQSESLPSSCLDCSGTFDGCVSTLQKVEASLSRIHHESSTEKQPIIFGTFDTGIVLSTWAGYLHIFYVNIYCGEHSASFAAAALVVHECILIFVYSFLHLVHQSVVSSACACRDKSKCLRFYFKCTTLKLGRTSNEIKIA